MRKLLFFLFYMASAIAGYAQPNQLNAQFYHNPYLLNPAMAAVDQGLSFFLGYSHQVTGMTDAGHTQALTASFRTGKTGLAIAGYQDRQGLMKRTRLLGAYAYHVSLDGDGRHLHFGLSVGMQRQQINESDIRGELGDPVIAGFNERRNYLDGAAGIAYSDANWRIQVALPELADKLNGNWTDMPGTSLFLVGGGYRFNAERAADGLTVEPKVYYRTFSGMSAIIDAGVSLSLKNKFTLDGLYHSSDRFTGGISAAITSQITGLLLYSNGVNDMNFFGERLELGLKCMLGRR